MNSGTGDDFLTRTAPTQVLRSTINKCDLLKLKSFFCMAKDTIIQTKQQATKWEIIFTNDTPSRVLISKIYKELKKDIKKTNNSIKNGVSESG